MKTKIALLFLMALIGCSKSNDPKPIFDISGKWSMASTTFNGTVTFTKTGTQFIAVRDTSKHITAYNDLYFIDSGGAYGSADQIGTFGRLQLNGSSKNNINGILQFVSTDGVISSDLKKITISKYYIKKDCSTSITCTNPYATYITENLVMTRIN